MTEKMTRAERAELGQLIRKREKVMKTTAEERAAAMLAEFDRASAAIYAYDDDEVWKQAHALAQAAVEQAQAAIEARCVEMGIPKEFAPGIGFGWYGRGQNAVKDRREELRRAAKARIELIRKEAVTRIERLSLAAQTEVISHGMESAAAREFLEKLPPIDALMPPIDPVEIQALIDVKKRPERNYLQHFASQDDS